MALCGSLSTTTTIAGTLALLQSAIGLGLNILFALFYFGGLGDSVVSSAGWSTLASATKDYTNALKGITITAGVLNLVWLATAILLLVGHARKNHNPIQMWVIVTSFCMLYDAVALIIFLAATVDMAGVKEVEKKIEPFCALNSTVTSPGVLMDKPCEFPNYLFYILDVFALGRLGPITIILNVVFCYYVQKRIFEIVKEKRKPDLYGERTSVPHLHGNNGIGTYLNEDTHEMQKRNGSYNGTFEMRPKNNPNTNPLVNPQAQGKLKSDFRSQNGSVGMNGSVKPDPYSGRHSKGLAPGPRDRDYPGEAPEMRPTNYNPLYDPQQGSTRLPRPALDTSYKSFQNHPVDNEIPYDRRQGKPDINEPNRPVDPRERAYTIVDDSQDPRPGLERQLPNGAPQMDRRDPNDRRPNPSNLDRPYPQAGRPMDPRERNRTDNRVSDRLRSFEETPSHPQRDLDPRPRMLPEALPNPHQKLAKDGNRGLYLPPVEPRLPRYPPAPPPHNPEYLRPVEGYGSNQPSPKNPKLRNQMFVPTPFVPKVDYNLDVSDSDDEQLGRVNPALDMSYDAQPNRPPPRMPPPEYPGLQQQPYQQDRAQHVAQLRAKVERDNSFRSQQGYRLRRENSDRSIQSDIGHQGNYNNNRNPRQARALPQPRRLSGHLSEEDERYYSQSRDNRNYDSDNGYDYRRGPQVSRMPHEGRQQF